MEQKQKASLLGTVITQFIVFIVCIGIPCAVTAIAPVSWVTLQRSEGLVNGRVETCLLFFVPFKTQVVEDVQSIDGDIHRGELLNQNRIGKKDRRRAEDEGFLVLQGKSGEARVQVSPASLPAVKEEAMAFLADTGAQRMSRFVVANWKFSVIGGGFASLLTLLYAGGLLFGIAKFLLKVAGLSKKLP